MDVDFKSKPLTHAEWLADAKDAIGEVLAKGMIKKIALQYPADNIAQLHIVGLITNPAAKRAAEKLVFLLNEASKGAAMVEQDVLLPELQL